MTPHLFFTGIKSARSPRDPGGGARRIRPACQRTLTVAEPLDPFLVWLLEAAGLTARHYRARSLARRIPACLRALRASSTEQARRMIERHPERLRHALDAVLLGVTEFFRDESVFVDLRERILPQLARLERPVRVWSPACSHGAELNSVAMLLDEAGLLAGATLLGSDCREEAIRMARTGSYPRAHVPDPASGWPTGKVRAVNGSAMMPEEIRAVTRWEVRDVLREAAPGPWDLVLWRNMAIYLDPGSAAEGWARMRREIRPGGFLVTGKAEYPPRHTGWERVAPCIYMNTDPDLARGCEHRRSNDEVELPAGEPVALLS